MEADLELNRDTHGNTQHCNSTGFDAEVKRIAVAVIIVVAAIICN
jgi:hypothetical protein